MIPIDKALGLISLFISLGILIYLSFSLRNSYREMSRHEKNLDELLRESEKLREKIDLDIELITKQLKALESDDEEQHEHTN